MEQRQLTPSEKRLKAIEARHRRKKLVRIIGCFVLFSTAAALILPAISQSNTTFCGLEEHLHEDSCYETQLICGYTEQEVSEETTGPPVEVTEAADETTATEETEQATDPPAVEVHEHTDQCYGQVTVCGMEEHSHSLACMSDPSADTETEADWTATFASVQLTGKAAQDILAIARTQLGYTESQNNFGVAADGVTKKGYTRYGAWFGEPYADWNALFAAFCATYANINKIPAQTDAADLAAVLMQDTLYRSAQLYTPQAGDLCILDGDLDGQADRVGIVESCSTADMTLTVIEGDKNGQVAAVTYDLRTSQLTGYLQLAEDQQTEGSATTQSSINVTGTQMYHPAEYLEYQYSSHKVNNYMTLNYVLVPYDEYSEDWQPSTLQWSANCGANYVVAYCADRDTDVNESGEAYVTLEIHQSAYADCAAALAGVVEHAYPFITADQMRAELQAAYQNGEIALDLSCCVESEFIAAAQWAVWDMTGLSGTQTTASGSTFPSYNVGALNPLSDVGHTNSSTIQSHVKAIRDWLVTQRELPYLTVTASDHTVTRNQDGSYRLFCTVELNRALINNETVYVTGYAGDKSFAQTVWGEGITSFEVEMDGLTEQELLEAYVSCTVTMEEMQVYIYDSNNYQDMISGQWGQTTYELYFDVEVASTSVDVTKYWTDDAVGAEYIQVQLYADGVAHGDPVRLSDDNDWTYTWSDLLKYGADGHEIYYTVSEFLVPGYLAQILRDDTGSRTVSALTEVAAFQEGGRYMLTYDGTNALMDTGGQLAWAPDQNILAPDTTNPAAYWIATSVTGDGSAYLQNAVTGNYISYDGTYITLSAGQTAKSYFLYNRFYLLNGIYNQYLIYLYEGLGYTTTGWDSGLDVTLLELTQQTRQAADVSYLISNTQTTENTSLEVFKEWAGRTAEEYPESATVQLLQDGAAYGPEVILSADNEWRYRWEDLPLKLGDRTFTYTVEELAMESYTPQITQSQTEDGITLFTILNIWTPEYMPIRLEKVDKLVNTTRLYGAEFELYRVVESEDAVTIPGQELTGVLEKTLVVSDGTVILEDLLVGARYYLIETMAPGGYDVLLDPIVFIPTKDEEGVSSFEILSGEKWLLTATDDDGTPVMKVMNKETYLLPETGGAGAYMYTAGGMLLTAAALYLLYDRKRRRKEDLSPS